MLQVNTYKQIITPLNFTKDFMFAMKRSTIYIHFALFFCISICHDFPYNGTICIKKGGMLTPNTQEYKRERRKVAVAFNIHTKMESEPLVPILIKKNGKNFLPTYLRRLNYLPLSYLAFLNVNNMLKVPKKKGGEVFLPKTDENSHYFLLVVDPHNTTHAEQLGVAFTIPYSYAGLSATEKKEKKEQARKLKIQNDIEKQQKRLHYFVQLRAQRKARMKILTGAKPKKETKTIEVSDDDELPTTEEIISETDEEAAQKFLEDDVKSDQSSSGAHRYRLSIAQRLWGPLEAKLDDSYRADHEDESGYSTEELID